MEDKKIKDIIFSFDVTEKNGDGGAMGEYYPRSKKIFIYLRYCSNIGEILTTLEHEVLHHILFPFKLNDQEEHYIMHRLLWEKFANE